jgi:hypothetical protein
MRTLPDEYLSGTPRHTAHHTIYRPGEGRGPAGKASVTTGRPSPFRSPDWSPAFAGVVARAEGPPP